MVLCEKRYRRAPFFYKYLFAALSPLPLVGRPLAWTGALSTGPGLTQKQCDVPTTGTSVPTIIAAGEQQKKPADVPKVAPITMKVGRLPREEVVAAQTIRGEVVERSGFLRISSKTMFRLPVEIQF